MMKKYIALSLLVLLVFMIGCSAHLHKVGVGSKTGDATQARQWYALWGLVPLNNVDTQTMAGGAADYEIKTEQSAMDIILNLFTGMITVYSRTVTVVK